MSVYFVSYAKRILYFEQSTFLLARRHLNTMILTNLENLNSISNIFQETHDFLVLKNPVIICTYLKTTDGHFRGQGNVHHPTSKLLKCDLVQTLNTFRNPSLRIIASGKTSLVCVYLRTSDRHFCDQGNVRHPTSKLLKCNVAQTLNTFWKPSLPVFAVRKASLVHFQMIFKPFFNTILFYKSLLI